MHTGYYTQHQVALSAASLGTDMRAGADHAIDFAWAEMGHAPVGEENRPVGHSKEEEYAIDLLRQRMFTCKVRRTCRIPP